MWKRREVNRSGLGGEKPGLPPDAIKTIKRIFFESSVLGKGAGIAGSLATLGLL